VPEAADRSIRSIDAVIAKAKVRARARGKRLRVLVVLDRQKTTLAAMVAAGPGSWADQLLAIIGADNVLADATVRYPRISAEQVLRGRPDVIVDASPFGSNVEAWSYLETVPAVAGNRVVASRERALTAPSPRIDDALTLLESVVYARAP